MPASPEKEETCRDRTAHPFQMFQEGLVHTAESCSSHQSSILLPLLPPLLLTVPSPAPTPAPHLPGSEPSQLSEPLFPSSSTPWVSSFWRKNTSSRNWWSSSAKNLINEPGAEFLEPLSQIISLKEIVLISITLLCLAKTISPLSACKKRKEKRNLDPPQKCWYLSAKYTRHLSKGRWDVTNLGLSQAPLLWLFLQIPLKQDRFTGTGKRTEVGRKNDREQQTSKQEIPCYSSGLYLLIKWRKIPHEKHLNRFLVWAGVINDWKNKLNTHFYCYSNKSFQHSWSANEHIFLQG